MNFARSFVAGLLLASVTSFADPATAQAAEGALDTFKARHNRVVQLTQEPDSDAKLQAEVDELLDYRALVETSLGGAIRYPNRCEPRCAEFEQLLTKLIRENYLKRLRTDKKYDLNYVGEDKRPLSTRVNTQIKHNKNGVEEMIEVVYVMHKVGDRWKVQDIVTEGVSLAKNYKFEFNKILRDQGIDELIRRLEAKLTELAKSDPPATVPAKTDLAKAK
ncbi:MAG: ABC transporter substrate-binding protein [Nannocystis sp.]|nr:ABC transporter substrate-binding protein [Nannocystis sp.]